jgi:hypothetical protein
LPRFEFESRTFHLFYLYLCSWLKDHVCLSRGVQVAGAAWRAMMRIVVGVGGLVQRIGDGRTAWVLSGRMIRRSADAVCGLHRTHGDDERGFVDLASKPRSTICHWFGLKTTGTVFSDLASKPVVMVFSGLDSKPMDSGFSVWASKLAATIW